MREIDYTEIEALAHEMKSNVDDASWIRGLQYFLDNRIKSISVDGQLVFAKVYGNERLPYTVQLDLTAFRRSFCSCPNERFCKHLVAVFFGLFEGFGDPVSFLANLVSAPTPMPTREQPVRPNPPRQTDPFSSWVSFSDYTYQQIAGNIARNGYFMSPDTHFVSPLSEASQSWPNARKWLHRLFVLVFLAHQADGLASEEGNRRHGYYATTVARRLLHECDTSMRSLAQQIKASGSMEALAGQPEFSELMDYARTLLLDASEGDGLVHTYGQLWMYFVPPEWDVDEEIEWLRNEMDRFSEAQSSHPAPWFAMGTLYLLAHQDASAKAIALKHPSVSWVTTWLEHLEDAELWDRLVEWLEFLFANDEAFDPRAVAPFTHYWILGAVHRPASQEACALYLETHMPYTQTAYDTFLLATEQYRRWVDTWMMRQTDPTYVGKDEIGIVERADRTLLLPWYHQAVEWNIRERNRKAYKQAVRLLKKLQTQYKKLKRLPEFEGYLGQLKSRYSRFRALHEELARKGLIDA